MAGWRADPCPRFLIEIAKHRDVRQTGEAQLAEKILESYLIEWRCCRVVVLIHSGQSLLIAASDAQGTVAKDALSIYQVSNDFTDAPLVIRIAVSLAFGWNSFQEHGKRIKFVKKNR